MSRLTALRGDTLDLCHGNDQSGNSRAEALRAQRKLCSSSLRPQRLCAKKLVFSFGGASKASSKCARMQRVQVLFDIISTFSAKAQKPRHIRFDKFGRFWHTINYYEAEQL
jgi:hypothetical protein